MPIKPASRWKNITLGEGNPLRDAVRKLKSNGEKILELTGGDPPAWGFANQPLSDYLVEAAETGWHTYNGNVNQGGLGASPPLQTQLQNAIASFEKRERGINLKPEKIIVGGGCAGAILMVHMAMLEEGDEVLTFDPAHYLIGPTSYFNWLKTKVVTCRCIEEENWQPDLDELRKKISDKTKLIVVNNPNNPTGKVYDEKILKNIISIAGEHDIPLMADEIYTFITFDGVVAKSMAAVADDVPVVIVNGLAKIFMRTGWKVGYVAIHDPEERIQEVINAIKKVWRLYGGQRRSLPTPILYAAIKAFQSSLDVGREFVKEVKKRRDYSIKRIKNTEALSCIEPQGTFYTFPRIEEVGGGRTWSSDMEFLTELVKEERITFNPGSDYGKQGFGHFRSISLPKIEILEDAFNRLEKFLKRRSS